MHNIIAEYNQRNILKSWKHCQWVTYDCMKIFYTCQLSLLIHGTMWCR